MAMNKLHPGGTLAAPAPKKSLGTIEVARGLAALLVVFYHASRHIEKESGVTPFLSAFQFGHAGVDLFFVISGFIICFIHNKDIGDPSRIPNYVYRRFTRIFPLFWVALIVALALAFATGKPIPGIDALFVDAMLLPGDSMVGVSWTLRSEMVFYLFFCALMILNRRLGNVLCVIWAGILLAAMAIPPLSQAIVLSSYNLQFLAGMAVAHTVLNVEFGKQTGIALLIAGVVGFLATGLAENTGTIDGYGHLARMLYGTAAAIFILGAAQRDRYHPGTSWQPAVFLGSVSFSIYLFHFFGIGIADKLIEAIGLDPLLNGETKSILLVIAGMTGGILVGLLVERPLQNFFRKHPLPASKKTAAAS